MWLRVSFRGSLCSKSAAFSMARLQVGVIPHQYTVLFSIIPISNFILIPVLVSLRAPVLERWCSILENHRSPESPEVLRMSCAEALCVGGVSLGLREHCRPFLSR